MFEQLFVGVHCHPYELVGSEDEEEVVQFIKSLPLLTSRCKLTTNGSPQEPLAEWTRTINVFFNSIMDLKPFSSMKISFLTC